MCAFFSINNIYKRRLAQKYSRRAVLVIAALTADGVSTVTGLEYIDRGYEDLAGKLKRLGADIRRE